MVRHIELMVDRIEHDASWLVEPQPGRAVVDAVLGPYHGRGGRRTVVFAEFVRGEFAGADGVDAAHRLRRRVLRGIIKPVLIVNVISPAIELAARDAAGVIVAEADRGPGAGGAG